MTSLFRRGSRIEGSAVPTPLTPLHWIDTTPVKIMDKPCTIRSLDVRVRVCGLYADVTETLVISNPNKRDLSVDVQIPMPDRAVVCGYALDIDGQMIDGVVVPKEKARIAFETEQRQGADPGLVESVKGNVYRTRVYPVPGHKTRTVQLRYVAPLLVVDGQAAFLDAPMPAERLGERTMRIDVELLDCPAPELSGINGAQFKELGTCWCVESCEQDVTPDSGVRVALPKLPPSFTLVERDDQGALWFAASECAPRTAEESVPPIGVLTVLWDASGSRASADHDDELELLRGYCAAKSVASYRLVSFSDCADAALTFDNADELLHHIGSLRYDGGSDFKALSQAISTLPADGACVLFTDGLDTLSGEPVSFPHGSKVLAVVSGTQRDTESLRQACGGLAFDLAAAPKGADALARALFCSNLLSGVSGDGVADVLGVGSGADGRFTVVGKLTASSTSVSFDNTGTKFALDAAQAREGAAIARAWAAIRVAQLSPRSDENADELLKLGRRFGVVSPATSLLVLERLDQWLRYDIEPPKTWEAMHSQWELRSPGVMRVSSEQGMRDDHLRELKRAWADLQNWWKRGYSHGDQPWGGSSIICRSCGAPLQENSLFCHLCGASVSTRGNARNIDYAASYSLPMAASAMDSSSDMAEPEGAMMGEPAPAMRGPAPRMMSRAAMAPARHLDRAQASLASDEAMDEPAETRSAASVKVQAWMPHAAYLEALDQALDDGLPAAREAYFQQRSQHANSPSFFVDCAGWFMANDDKPFGLRVLTNLAELRIEDAALLRVMAWRLREAGELSRALVVLRRVLGLRAEDSQSHRDLALVLDELAREAFGAGNEDAARGYAEEAGGFYRKIATTPWQRRSKAVGLFAVEEYNVLRAWVDAQTWKDKPQLASLGDDLEGVLDCDLRITLAWDADETDVDLHVTEPTGEEAYYGHRLTHDGGRVSEDITDGYGPELYEIRHARDGAYVIRAHYYASHQQTVFGPASCTLTVYTDWGRPTQAQQITSTRLEDEREMVPVGTATYGDVADAGTGDGAPEEGTGDSPVVKGSTVAELISAYGEPTQGDSSWSNGQLTWSLPGGRVRVAVVIDGKVERVVERMPWGEELVIVQ